MCIITIKIRKGGITMKKKALSLVLSAAMAVGLLAPMGSLEAFAATSSKDLVAA